MPTPHKNSSEAWKEAMPHYRKFAADMTPQLQTLLSGRKPVPPQRPFTEAWITYALYCQKSHLPVPLENVLASADAINHAVPIAAEVAWALLRLRKRGWLVEGGNTYGLTPASRSSVGTTLGEGGLWERVKRLESWTTTHPTPVTK